VLALLEAGDRRPGRGAGPLEELPLFAAAQPVAEARQPAGPGPLEAALDALRPDELSPRAALDAVYRLKELRARSTNR
jgi:DNA mismatch repair protein MutS